MAGSTCIFQARDIGRQTPNGKWLFRDVSLEINHHDRIGIIGPSGSGKSVLLRALAMLDVLDGGQILWKGKSVEHDLVTDFRSRVMYLQQQPVLSGGTVEDNLREPFGWLSHRLQSFHRNQIVDDLKFLNRDETFLWKSGRDLSGGESTIVAFLRAIQFDPSVLLLDEPTSALDEATALRFEQRIEDWLQGSGFKAFVWVSHDRNQIERVSNRIIEVDQGRIHDAEFVPPNKRTRLECQLPT